MNVNPCAPLSGAVDSTNHGIHGDRPVRNLAVADLYAGALLDPLAEWRPTPNELDCGSGGKD